MEKEIEFSKRAANAMAIIGPGEEGHGIEKLLNSSDNLKSLFERNFKAVVNRGLITPETQDIEFYEKAVEEIDEIFSAKSKDHVNEEIADLLIVCANWLHHRGVNLEEILTHNAIKNELRALK
jgi:phosphoribosyl-ATP pyrophosphohydrolase